MRAGCPNLDFRQAPMIHGEWVRAGLDCNRRRNPPVDDPQPKALRLVRLLLPFCRARLYRRR
jgi:hypothetical protein